MSINTNSPYKPPKEYEPKNKDFMPKTKPTSVIMIVLGGLLIVAFTVAVIWGAIFGISKIVEGTQKGNDNSGNDSIVNQA